MKTAAAKRIVLILATAVLFLLLLALWPVDYLLITTLKNGRVILAMPMTAGPDFSIGYIHSVDIKPVFEVFTVKKGSGGKRDIFIVETYFKMFGAGMGHWPGHGRLVRRNGWTWIKDINERLGEFVLRIGSPGVDHTIYYDHHETNLSRSAPGQAALCHVVSTNRLQAAIGYWPN